MRRFDPVYLFLKLNVWLCVASSVLVVASAVALSIPLSAVGAGALLPPLLFYVIYVEDRRNVSHEDRTNQPYRTQLVERYRRGLLATELLALAGYEILLLFLLCSHSTASTASTAAVGLVLLGQLPFGVLAAYGHLKRYPTFDSVAVGATWAFVIVFAVLVSAGHQLSRDVWIVYGAWFIIVFAGVESRNIADVEGDARADKMTLAAYLGTTPTRALEVLLKAIGTGVFWYVSGVTVAAIVVAYLVFLWTFRVLARRIDASASQ